MQLEFLGTKRWSRSFLLRSARIQSIERIKSMEEKQGNARRKLRKSSN